MHKKKLLESFARFLKTNALIRHVGFKMSMNFEFNTDIKYLGFTFRFNKLLSKDFMQKFKPINLSNKIYLQVKIKIKIFLKKVLISSILDFLD